ncbi:Ger(x)C family spore germination protein, partial [Priestia megaterium]
MKRKWAVLLLMILVTALLSSCWSKKELTDLAIVSAVGIDKTKDGKYHLT